MKRVLCINTGGVGNLHGLRMRRLTAQLHADVTYYDLDRSGSRWKAGLTLWSLIRDGGPWDLIYQEGTGISSGACLIHAAKQWGQRFIVSSGDPIAGFFEVTRGKTAARLFGFYERSLYRACAAFVGWTPYLTGAALHLGAPRGITVEGAVDLDLFRPLPAADRSSAKVRYKLPSDALVCGVVGSLTWTAKQQYCYGLELVETLKRTKRKDVCALIVGEGNGRARLEAAVPAELKTRVVFAGRLSEGAVVEAMNAMDVGFVTQTLDALGNFRLTTKLPEYLACGIPVAMSPVPGFYDYAASAGWALPPFHPASAIFHQACAEWLDGLNTDSIKIKADRALELARERFDYSVIAAKFCDFIRGLLSEVEDHS